MTPEQRLEALIKARDGVPGFAKNVAYMRARLKELQDG
jgi:hypothetical protein